MKTILVPTDFSRAAQNATDAAVSIAKKSGAELMLLHVVELPTRGSFNVEGQVAMGQNWEAKMFASKLIERAKNLLAESSMEIVNKGVKVKSQLRLGDPFHGIRAIIIDRNVDLVVMGTFGQSKMEKALVGSNTQHVIRYAKCPVLSIHNKPMSADCKNIVYATSMVHDEEVFSKIVKSTQQIFKSTIHLVHINTPSTFQSDRVVRKYMQQFVKKLRLQSYTINIFNDYHTEEGILHFADIVNADLIAMATHGRTGLAHLLKASVAEKVANQAKRPVLTLAVKHAKKS